MHEFNVNFLSNFTKILMYLALFLSYFKQPLSNRINFFYNFFIHEIRKNVESYLSNEKPPQNDIKICITRKENFV